MPVIRMFSLDIHPSDICLSQLELLQCKKLANDISIDQDWGYYFDFNIPSVMLAKRTDNFEENFKNNNCTFFAKYLL